MNYQKHKRIYKKLGKKHFHPQHIAEVGVYHPETSNLFDFINDDIRTTLVEPDPKSIEQIKSYFHDRKNITLHEVAIYEKSGTITLAQRNASTFISELESAPAIINDDYNVKKDDIFDVPAKTFDEVDDGTIDLLSVDIEGSEWFVIKNMVSRPDVISIETHGAMYTNPKIAELSDWMKNNSYLMWYKDRSDTVYVKKGSINISILDKLKLYFYEIYLMLRKYRKSLKKWIKGVLSFR